jgi:hypothetical protein
MAPDYSHSHIVSDETKYTYWYRFSLLVHGSAKSWKMTVDSNLSLSPQSRWLDRGPTTRSGRLVDIFNVPPSIVVGVLTLTTKTWNFFFSFRAHPGNNMVQNERLAVSRIEQFVIVPFIPISSPIHSSATYFYSVVRLLVLFHHFHNVNIVAAFRKRSVNDRQPTYEYE